MGKAPSQELFEKLNQNGAMNKIKYDEDDDLGRKKEMVGRQNVVFPCFEIREPEANNGLIGDRDSYILSIFAAYQKSLERTKLSLGHCLNFDFDYRALGGLPNYVLNNCGDPFIEINFYGHSRQFEVGVLDWFARLWEIEKEDYWGYVTNGGTEGNMHGILLGRELFPDGILYTSRESHYSVVKAARMYRMECIKIDTLVSGEIDCAHFMAKLLENKHKPAIVNVTLGSTVKGAIDDLDLVIQTLEECGFQQDRFYIHCDGALFGVMLPFLEGAPRITFKKPIGSISVSGHKFIGCPMPCGVQMTRLEHIKVLSRDIEFLATKDATIAGSRSGQAPIFLWYALNRKGCNGLKSDAHKCLRNALYLKNRLKEAGISVMLNERSNIVVFERPLDIDVIRRWQLLCDGNIVHVVVMPSDTLQKLDSFIDELFEKRLNWLKDESYQARCVATQIGNENCVCDIHKAASEICVLKSRKRLRM